MIFQIQHPVQSFFERQFAYKNAGEIVGYIDEGSVKRLKAMVGFRNIAVRDSQTINLDILCQIIEKHLDDFSTYTKQILNL